MGYNIETAYYTVLILSFVLGLLIGVFLERSSWFQASNRGVYKNFMGRRYYPLDCTGFDLRDKETGQTISDTEPILKRILNKWKS